MIYHSKIKMSMGWIYPIGILSAYILGISEWALRSYLRSEGTEIAQIPLFTYWIVGIFFFAMGILQWFRYRNWIYPVLGLLVGNLTIQASFAMEYHTEIMKITYFFGLIVLVLFVVLNWQTIYSQERFELNSRRLFRLAAERIFQTGNGFTERHFSAGKLECTKDELLGFVRFMHGNYITRPFYLDDNISLAFSMNKSLLVIHDPVEVSHVIIDYNGNISVKISAKDYHDYRERFSFDQLCSNMSTVFIRFFEYYRNGLESRIISELKSAR